MICDREGYRVQTDSRITLSDRDMILCRCEGSAFIVRDYRRVFQTLRTTGRSERLAKVAANTCVVKFRERLDVIQIWGSRLFCHSAEVSTDAMQLIPDGYLHPGSGPTTFHAAATQRCLAERTCPSV